MDDRGSGILLHISSLPSRYGIGDLGPQAYRFVEFLSDSGQQYWQILPLNPTGTYLGNSPYTSYSVFAGNALFISVDALAHVGLLSPSDLESALQFPEDRVQYQDAIDWKSKILRRAFHHAESRIDHDRDFEKFCHE